MMRLLLFFCCVCITTFSNSQDFEGTLEYKMEYPYNATNKTETELKLQLGSYVTTHIKNGFYKEITDSNFLSYQLYRSVDTTIYYKHDIKSDTLKFSKTNSVALVDAEYRIEKNVDTILGYVCDKLVVTNKYGSLEYYYSNQLSLDPEFFKEYTYSNKYEVVKRMKAVYLRLKLNYQVLTVDITAVKINKRTLIDSFFDLPKYVALKEEKI